MFTSQHYDAVAKVLLAQVEHTTVYVPETTGIQAVTNLVHAFSILFHNDNNRFEIGEFQKACGLAVKEEA